MSRKKQSSSDDRSMKKDQDDLSGSVVASLERENLNEDDSVPEVIKV